MRKLIRRSTLGLAISLLLACTTTFFSASTVSAAGFKFTTFELSSVTGTVCPGSSQCTNFAAEPQIRADLAGNFYASSENGLGGGTDAWRSTDGGLHYTSLDCPDCLSRANDTCFAPGGGTTDLAVAPARNPAGFYNVY